MSKLAIDICENGDHTNFSRVIQHAIINGRSDFFELLCAMESNIFMMFPLDKDDHFALRDKANGDLTKVLSKKYHKINTILDLLINMPVCTKSGYRFLGFPLQRHKEIQNNMHILTLWDTMFLWSIILWHDECAHKIWKKVENPVAMALIAYSVRKAVRRITNSKLQAAQMEINMDKWSNLANDTLNECFNCDADMSKSLLLMEQPYWNNMMCFEIALHAGNKDFIRQHACQYLLDDIWKGGDHDNTNDSTLTMFVVAITALMFPCLFMDHLKVPWVKFLTNAMAHALFLILFACVLLFDMPTTVSASEYVLFSWMLTILAQEIAEMASDCKTCFENAWNYLDVGAVVVYFVGFGMRFRQFSSTFDAPRLVLAVDFVAFTFRLIQMFSVHEVLGPKLTMIKRMVQDLMYFLVILSVFFVSYAVASHSVLYPDSPTTWGTVHEVLRRPYWHLYGSLFLEETEGMEECSDNATQTVGASPRCPSETGKRVVPIMMGLYMLFVNILLLNMLIAMFSFTISEIHINAEKHWAYERYFVVKEYISRNVYVPPLSIILNIYQLIQCCQKKQNVFKADSSSPFRKVFSGAEATRIIRFQANTVNKFLELQKNKISTEVESKMFRQMMEEMTVFKTTVLEELRTMRDSYQQLNMKREENTGK